MPWSEELVIDKKSGAVNGVILICSGESHPIARVEFHIHRGKDEDNPLIDLVLVPKTIRVSAEQSVQKRELDKLIPVDFEKYTLIKAEKTEADDDEHNESIKPKKSKEKDDPFGYKPLLFRNVSDYDLMDLNRILAKDSDPQMFLNAISKINLEPLLASYASSGRADRPLLVRHNAMRDGELDQILDGVSLDDSVSAPMEIVVDEGREAFITKLKQLTTEQHHELEKFGKCPISREIIFDPVRITVGGNTTFFDREFLNGWCERGVTNKIIANGSYLNLIQHPILGIPFNLETFKSLITEAPELKRRIRHTVDRMLNPPVVSPHPPQKPKVKSYKPDKNKKPDF